MHGFGLLQFTVHIVTTILCPQKWMSYSVFLTKVDAVISRPFLGSTTVGRPLPRCSDILCIQVGMLNHEVYGDCIFACQSDMLLIIMYVSIYMAMGLDSLFAL